MTKRKQTLLVTLIFVAISTTTVSIATPGPKLRQTQQAYVINCKDANGNVVSFGAECRAGNSDCTGNPCP